MGRKLAAVIPNDYDLPKFIDRREKEIVGILSATNSEFMRR